MKLFGFFVLMVAFYGVNAATRRNCGNILVQVLETICSSGNYNIPTKKSANNDLDIVDMYKDVADIDTSELFEDVSMGKHANNFSKIRRRREFLGIYEECCVRGCSLSQIATYCN